MNTPNANGYRSYAANAETISNFRRYDLLALSMTFLTAALWFASHLS